jgi:Ni/Co efflux regulator RcnB
MDDSLCPECGHPQETGGGCTRNGCILYYPTLAESLEQYRRGETRPARTRREERRDRRRERREMREEARDAFWEGVGEAIARFVSRIVD